MMEVTATSCRGSTTDTTVDWELSAGSLSVAVSRAAVAVKVWSSSVLPVIFQLKLNVTDWPTGTVIGWGSGGLTVPSGGLTTATLTDSSSVPWWGTTTETP